MFNLHRKIVAITGGGSGIGKAIAEMFAAQGANVNILELNTATGEETVKQITSKGGIAKSHAVQCSGSSAGERGTFIHCSSNLIASISW